MGIPSGARQGDGRCALPQGSLHILLIGSEGHLDGMLHNGQAYSEAEGPFSGIIAQCFRRCELRARSEISRLVLYGRFVVQEISKWNWLDRVEV